MLRNKLVSLTQPKDQFGVQKTLATELILRQLNPVSNFMAFLPFADFDFIFLLCVNISSASSVLPYFFVVSFI
jgi:hypothetical protein